MFIELYANFGDIILFSSLELKTSQLDSAASCLSMLSAVIMLGIAIISLVFHFKILNKYQNIRKFEKKEEKIKEKIESFEKEYAGVQVVFGAFKDPSFSSQGHLFFFVLRAICSNLTLAYLYEYPLAQSIIMMLLTLAMVAYLGIKRPFKIIVHEVQQLTFEMMLLTVNFVLVILSGMDSAGSTSSREGLSQVILIINLLFGFLPSCFLAAKVIFMGIEYFKQRKLDKLKVKTAPNDHNKAINFPDVNTFSTSAENLNTHSVQIPPNSRFNPSNQRNPIRNIEHKEFRINQQYKNPNQQNIPTAHIESVNLPNNHISFETSNISLDYLLDSNVLNSSSPIQYSPQRIRSNTYMNQNQALQSNLNINIRENESPTFQRFQGFDNNPLTRKMKKRNNFQKRENNIPFEFNR